MKHVPPLILLTIIALITSYSCKPTEKDEEKSPSIKIQSIGERQTWAQNYVLESCCCSDGTNKTGLEDDTKVIDLKEGLRFGAIISTGECGQVREKDLYCNFRVTVPNINNYGIGHELKCSGSNPANEYNVIRTTYNNLGQKIQTNSFKCNSKTKMLYTLESSNNLNSNSIGYEIMIKKGTIVGYEASFAMIGSISKDGSSDRTKCSLRALPGQTQSCGQNSRYCIPTAFECNGFNECPMGRGPTNKTKSHDESEETCPREVRTSGTKLRAAKKASGRSMAGGPVQSLNIFSEKRQWKKKVKGNKFAPGEYDRDHRSDHFDDDLFEDWDELERTLRELKDIIPELAGSKETDNGSNSWWHSIYAAIAILFGFFAALISFCKNLSRCIKTVQTVIEHASHVGEYLLNFKAGVKVAADRTGLSGLINRARNRRSSTTAADGQNSNSTIVQEQ